MCRPHTHQARTCVCTHYDTCVCFTRIMHAISWWQIFQRICVRVRSSRSSAQKSADCHASTPLPPPPPPPLPPSSSVSKIGRRSRVRLAPIGRSAELLVRGRGRRPKVGWRASVVLPHHQSSPALPCQHALSLQSAPYPSTRNPKCADSRYTFSV